jgi:hypothetical protein
MKINSHKLNTLIFSIIGFIIIAFIVVVLFISPIAKYMGTKYGEKYTGRQIKMGLVYVNPFTGYVHISNLRIYDSKNSPDITNSDSLFFSAKGVTANFALFKMLTKNIEITKITLYRPIGIIIQKRKQLNFDDLIQRYTPDKSDTTPSKFHFSILKITIINGIFYYHEKEIPVNYYIKGVNIESSGWHWKQDSIGAYFSLTSGTGNGMAEGSLTINFKNLDYRFSTRIQKFDLKTLVPYFKELTNFGTFSANLDANIKATGNFLDQENIHANGLIALNDFHFGKNTNDDYASFDILVLNIIDLSPKYHRYIFGSLLLNKPFFKYERYDYLDNLQMMFGKSGANILAANANPAKFNLVLKIADYIKVLAKNFFQSDYKINKLSIYNGCFQFNDYAISKKFSIEANPLNFVADSVNKNRKRVQLSFNSGIKPYGKAFVDLSINPIDSGDFDLKYNIQGLPVTIFNPYLITYTSYPLNRGTIELNGKWRVRNSKINSDNHILVIDPRVASRIKTDGTKWAPLPFVMAIIRERGNVIDYEIPITGNLKSPSFHLHYIIVDIIKNIFVKPPTTPYRMEVRRVEREIEKSLTLTWPTRQNTLSTNQGKFVNKMAEYLIKNSEDTIAVYPMLYNENENECIEFFEAKKKYFLSSKTKNAQFLSKKDSLKVEKMSVKDSFFVQYINKQIHDKMLFTVQDKCIRLLGSAFINNKFKQLNAEREGAFMLRFKEKAIETRVKIFAGENTIPYNGFSFYKIVYKGNLPESLIRAYNEMNKLNNIVPRKSFEKVREKIGSVN